MKAIELGITNDRGVLKRNGRVITDEKIIPELLKKDKNLTYTQAEELITEWKNNDSNTELVNINEYIKQEVYNSGILDNFIIVKQFGASLLHYKGENNDIHFIAALPANNAIMAYAFQTYCPQDFQYLRETLTPYIRPKLHVAVDDTLLTNVILNANNFFTDIDKKIELPRGIKPVTINGKELAYHNLEIPKKKDIQLSKYLQEFLNRVTDHKQLCAILWLMFNGIKTPYVVYLQGSGGDGKSSFIEMLCRLVKSYAAFELDGKHKYYHMFGKALLVLTENTDTYLLQNKSVKEVTGNSNVSCQEKGKTSFTSTITGLLIVDSNLKPKLIGEEYEFRRLRYFEVTPPSITERLSVEDYINELGNSPVDFVNYCEQCYDEVGKNNQVENSESMYTLTKTLIDSAYTYKFEKAIKKCGFNIGEGLEMDVNDFYDTFYKKVKEASSDRFLLDNLKTYLRIYYKVFELNGKLTNISLG